MNTFPIPTHYLPTPMIRFIFSLTSDSHSSELIVPAPCVESAHSLAAEMFPEGELTFLGVHVQ